MPGTSLFGVGPPLPFRLPSLTSLPPAIGHHLPAIGALLVTLFLLVQAVVDWRDGRLSDARRHVDDDSLTFR